MKFRLALLILGLSLLLAACNFSLAADITPPPGYQSPTPPPTVGPLFPSAAPDPQNGQLIYAQNCAPCHGDTGMGDGPQGQQLPNPVTALGLPEVACPASPAQWFQVVTQGNLDKFMPPFAGTLSAQERWDVVAYAMSLSLSPDQIAQGEQLYQANCARCHGPDGTKEGKANFTDQTLMAKLSPNDLFNTISQGSGTEMPAFADQLSQDERWAVASYIRTFTIGGPLQVVSMPEATLTTALSSEGAAPIETQAPGVAAPTPEGAATTETTTTVESLGTVTGTVSNGSGGEVPHGLVINLHGFEQNQSGNVSEILNQQATVQPDGSFTFTDVPVSPNQVLMTVTQYSGTSYSSQIISVESGTSTYDLPITIYDTSTDASILTVDRWHIFLDFTNPNSVQVIEVFIVSNPTSKAVVPRQEGAPVLSFHLPNGAQNLQFESGQLGGRYIQTTDGFGDTESVNPGSGQHQILFAFDLPYNKKMDFSQQEDLPVDSAIVMVPLGVSAKSDLLQEGGTRDFQGSTYSIYTTQPLPAGAILNMTVSGNPKSSTAAVTGIDSHRNILIGVGAFGLVLVLAGGWLYWRDRKRTEEDEEDLADETQVEEFQDSESVMDAIIALDDLHRAGKLPEEVYQQRRAELKAQLKELL
jgi:mono/diheme cytochrome c family protein